jgi:hypothetical protein
MPFEKPHSTFSYSKLFLVVLLAVAGGNLLSNWITARVVEYKLAVAASEASAQLKQEISQARQDAAIAQARAQQEATTQAAQLEQSRRDDKVGTKLSQACTEWTKANQELQSYTTKTEREKACAKLNAYVQSGIVPRE